MCNSFKLKPSRPAWSKHLLDCKVSARYWTSFHNEGRTGTNWAKWDIWDFGTLQKKTLDGSASFQPPTATHKWNLFWGFALSLSGLFISVQLQYYNQLGPLERGASLSNHYILCLAVTRRQGFSHGAGTCAVTKTKRFYIDDLWNHVFALWW